MLWIFIICVYYFYITNNINKFLCVLLSVVLWQNVLSLAFSPKLKIYESNPSKTHDYLRIEHQDCTSLLTKPCLLFPSLLPLHFTVIIKLRWSFTLIINTNVYVTPPFITLPLLPIKKKKKNWASSSNSISRKLFCRGSKAYRYGMWVLEWDLDLKPSSATFYLCDPKQIT